MEQQAYLTKIALYLQTRGSTIQDIRNNIPSGIDAFELKANNEPVNYYEFIDYICSNLNFNCSIKTCYAEVVYCNYGWYWKATDDSTMTDSVKRLIVLLNDLNTKATFLRSFEQFEV